MNGASSVPPCTFYGQQSNLVFLIFHKKELSYSDFLRADLSVLLSALSNLLNLGNIMIIDTETKSCNSNIRHCSRWHNMQIHADEQKLHLLQVMHTCLDLLLLPFCMPAVKQPDCSLLLFRCLAAVLADCLSQAPSNPPCTALKPQAV